MDWSRVEREFSQCNKCGLCLAACPVGKELLLEKYTPRGKVQLARFYSHGAIEVSERMRDIFAECLLCGACLVTCPSGVGLLDLLREMRKVIASKEGIHPRMAPATTALEKAHNISDEDNEERDEWSEDMRDVPREAYVKERAEIAYFVGCVASFFPMVQGIPQSVVRILYRAGVEFTILEGNEWCCGFPLIGAGAPGDLKKLREHNIDAVKSVGAKKVVFSCPSCYRVWREFYNTDLELMHITELIADLLAEGRLQLGQLPETVTYHDPCDLGRHGGVFDAPRTILRQIPGISLKEMESNRVKSVCCGGGGNLEMSDPDLSRRLALKKVEQGRATGAATLVTACQQCVRTIKGAARRAKIDFNVMDITELVAKLILHGKK